MKRSSQCHNRRDTVELLLIVLTIGAHARNVGTRQHFMATLAGKKSSRLTATIFINVGLLEAGCRIQYVQLLECLATCTSS